MHGENLKLPHSMLAFVRYVHDIRVQISDPCSHLSDFFLHQLNCLQLRYYCVKSFTLVTFPNLF